ANNYQNYVLTVRAGEDRLTFEANKQGQPMLHSMLHWFHQRVEKYPKDLVFLTQAGRDGALQQVLDEHLIPAEKVKINEVLKIVYLKDEFQIVPYGELEGLYLPETKGSLFYQDLIHKNRHLAEGRHLGEAGHA